MDSFSDYLRIKRKEHHDMLRGFCVHPTKKILFYKPGRTAGTLMFRKILQPMGGWIIQKDNRKQFDAWVNTITDEELSKYKKCIITRNPFSRLVSTWEVLYKTKQNMSFEKFIKTYLLNGDTLFPDRIHFMALTHFVEVPGSNSPNIDFHGKMETLASSWDDMCDVMGIKCKKIKTLKDADYRPLYTEELRGIVENYYKRDLELFDYEF